MWHCVVFCGYQLGKYLWALIFYDKMEHTKKWNEGKEKKEMSERNVRDMYVPLSNFWYPQTFPKIHATCSHRHRFHIRSGIIAIEPEAMWSGKHKRRRKMPLFPCRRQKIPAKSIIIIKMKVVHLSLVRCYFFWTCFFFHSSITRDIWRFFFFIC